LGVSFAYRNKGKIGWGLQLGVGAYFKKENDPNDADKLHVSLGGKIYPFQNKNCLFTRDLFAMVSYGTLSAKEVTINNKGTEIRTLHGPTLMIGGDWNIYYDDVPKLGFTITGGVGSSIDNRGTLKVSYDIGIGFYKKL
jgi:hypothetical protein